MAKSTRRRKNARNVELERAIIFEGASVKMAGKKGEVGPPRLRRRKTGQMTCENRVTQERLVEKEKLNVKRRMGEKNRIDTGKC